MKLRYLVIIPAAAFILSLVLFAFEIFLARRNWLSESSIVTYDKSVSLLGMLSVIGIILGLLLAGIIFSIRKLKRKV